ncbi:MAG: hypothetical protein DRQ44_05550 [Gammaproteobacteria bacterium]|nr:MAG: hypothetical protein DRQ44_05550 [Gammaproteobacteria bacterium]
MLGRAAEIDSSALRAVVTLQAIRGHQAELQAIANANGGNRAEGTSGFNASLDYVADQLFAAGYAVTIESFDTTANLIAELPGSDDRLVIVGAHLDSVSSGPGIQDNGSGSAAILEIALQMKALNIESVNRVRFVWWSGEETSSHGVLSHVLNMSMSEREAALYLNFDMIGSPNFVRFVYDGDSSDSVTVNPAGSEKIEAVFLDYFAGQGLATKATDFSEHQALPIFRIAGIPVGGLFAGAFAIKTTDEAAIFGGTAGDQHDPCHHLACDTFANVSLEVLDQFSDAAAHAVLYFALTSIVEERLADLISTVRGLVIPSKDGLSAKLDAALTAVEAGNERAAMNILRAFINQVEAKRRSGGLSNAEADALVATAQIIIDSLS